MPGAEVAAQGSIIRVDFGATAPVAAAVAFAALDSFRCGRFDVCHLYVDVTKGNLTNVLARVEFSDDDTNWYRVSSIDAGTQYADMYLIDYRMSTDGLYRIEIPTTDEYIRISLAGTGADNTNSSATVVMSFSAK